MVSTSVTGKLDCKKPEEWKRWIERFQCYRVAAGLDELKRMTMLEDDLTCMDACVIYDAK